MKLNKTHLFFLLLLVLLFSNLGLVIREGAGIPEQNLEQYTIQCELEPRNKGLRAAPVSWDNSVVQGILAVAGAGIVGVIIYYLI